MARRLFLSSSKISFSEQFFPARPKGLWSKARKFVRSPIVSKRNGAAKADNKNYVKWLVDESLGRGLVPQSRWLQFGIRHMALR